MKQRPRIYYTEEQKALMWASISTRTLGRGSVLGSRNCQLVPHGTAPLTSWPSRRNDIGNVEIDWPAPAGLFLSLGRC
jgi:hypothetical protein